MTENDNQLAIKAQSKNDKVPDSIKGDNDCTIVDESQPADATPQAKCATAGPDDEADAADKSKNAFDPYDRFNDDFPFRPGIDEPRRPSVYDVVPNRGEPYTEADGHTYFWTAVDPHFFNGLEDFDKMKKEYGDKLRNYREVEYTDAQPSGNRQAKAFILKWRKD